MCMANYVGPKTQFAYFGRRVEWNEEAHWAHFGEDGPGVELEKTRQMFIEEQNYAGNLQYWFMEEVIYDLPPCDEGDDNA